MTTPPQPVCCPCPPPGRAAGLLFCDCTAPGTCVQFVRIYLDDGTVSDTAIGGGPYTPVGTVGPCTEDQTDGCDTTMPVAVVSLCLADGTPVAVTVQRDCDGTVSSPGWVNLATGVYTEGPAPAGAGACGATEPCASPTTPIATTGLCLADGTPIATVSQRDCDGVVTQSGWIQLTTGAYATGLPPAGTRACGSAQSIQVSGVFCDTDPGTGEVFALVLVEYTYAPDGSIESVRIVRASDGTTYVLQGELSICPGGGTEMDVETELVCLLDAGGTLISRALAEYGYATSTGDRMFLRFTDPITGAVIAPPAGATVDENCDRQAICYAAATPTEDCGPGVLTVAPTVDPPIASAAVEANPNGFTVSSLPATIDGNISGSWGTITTNSGGSMPGLVLRYTFTAPADIAGIRLYNQYGGILNDRDGIGSGTLTVLDAADNVLWTGPLVAMNGGAPQVTAFGEVLHEAASFTLSDLTRNPTAAVTTIGFREITAVAPYQAQIVWDCPNETITAQIEGVSAGLAYDGVNLTQTNGPHTFTFSSSLGAFSATIDTDNPAAWSTTTVSDIAPDTVLSGNGTLTMRVFPSLLPTIEAGWLNPDGTITDANTGAVVPGATIEPCVAPREPDHVVTSDVVEMCDAGTPFLRQIRVTRDGNVQITDTQLNGRVPYTVSAPGVPVTGPCPRERLADACAETGPLIAPVLTGFTAEGDCLVTTAANPSATWTGDIESIEFAQDAGITGGSGYQLIVNGGTTIAATAFTPALPVFPGTVSDYVGTATVAGITVTAQQLSGGLARNGGSFAPAGRMRFMFSPNVTSVQVQTTAWGNTAANTLCDPVVLPSLLPDPQPLAVYRNADGTVTYYATDGSVVTDPVLLPCGACCGDTEPQGCETPLVLGEVCYSPPVPSPDAPLPVTDLLMQGTAFNDAAGEDMCAIVPAPTSESGWTVIGACRNPTVANPTLGWAGPVQSVEMEYGDAASANADGGVFLNFSATETGPITWTANATPMTVGEVRTSDVLPGARFARLTYVSGPSNANAPRMQGGTSIFVHSANTTNDLPIRFRLDLFGPGSITGNEVFARASVTRECDGTIVYTDLLTGTVLDPAEIVLAQCPGTDGTDVETQLVCLMTAGGVLIQQVIAEYGYDTITGDRLFVRYTDPTTGNPVEPPVGSTVQDCASVLTAPGPDAVLSTGIRRLTGDTAAVALATEFPGLQAVTLSVIAGTVAVTMTDGAAVTVPATTSLSWSVTDTDDSSLGVATFDGLVGSDYLLHWTWKPTAAG